MAYEYTDTGYDRMDTKSVSLNAKRGVMGVVCDKMRRGWACGAVGLDKFRQRKSRC